MFLASLKKKKGQQELRLPGNWECHRYGTGDNDLWISTSQDVGQVRLGLNWKNYKDLQTFHSNSAQHKNWILAEWYTSHWLTEVYFFDKPRTNRKKSIKNNKILGKLEVFSSQIYHKIKYKANCEEDYNSLYTKCLITTS